MINVLYYIEPHPIRNTFTEHLNAILFLKDELEGAYLRGAISLRIFANDEVNDEITMHHSNLAPYLQRPTYEESLRIRSFHKRWTDGSINDWIDLVNGVGEITDFYVSILDRLHKECPVDVVLCWSENGAVKNFTKKNAINALYGELGPTRFPFPETFYFDPEGTNGRALIRRSIREELEYAEERGILGDMGIASSCLAMPKVEDDINAHQEPSVIDLPVTWNADALGYMPHGDYVFIPLQLTDDLNTILHSKFKSPKEFLEHVIPEAKRLGYYVVVKGHPGAPDRPYNMIREIAALQYLENEHPDVVILPRDIGSHVTNHVLANACYAVCINSSVGFEAMLLGVPPIVLGDAVYDADGWLQDRITFLPHTIARDFSSVMNPIVSLMMSKYLLNKSQLNWKIKASTPLVDLLGDTASSQIHKPKPIQTINYRDDCILLHESGVEVSCLPITGKLLGFIEHASISNGRIKVIGWSFDVETIRPPHTILLIDKLSVIENKFEFVSRRDVIASFEKSPLSDFVGFQLDLIYKPSSRGKNLKLVFVTYDKKALIVDCFSKKGDAVPIQPKIHNNNKISLYPRSC